MSNSEDYLDSLLNSINKVKEDITREEETDKKRISSVLSSPKIKTDDDFLAATGLSDPFAGIALEKRRAYEDLDFLREFEEELQSGEADRFIRDFETELDEEEASSTPPLAEDTLMDSIEGIVSAAKRQANVSMAEDLSAAREIARKDVALEQAESEARGTLGGEPGLGGMAADDGIEPLDMSGFALPDDPIFGQPGAGVDSILGQPGAGVDSILGQPGAGVDSILGQPGDDSASILGQLGDENDAILGVTDVPGGMEGAEGMGDFDLGMPLDQPDPSLGEDIGLMDENADIDLSALMGGDEDLGEIADLMNADALGEAVEGAGDELDENTRRSLEGEDTEALEAERPKGLKGLLQRLKGILFGADDDEDEKKAGLDMQGAPVSSELEGLSEEQIEIMKNLSGESSGEDAGAKQDGKKDKKKKKGKKGKKDEEGEEEDEKKGKKKKEKAPRPPRERKPKKPKAPAEKEPPLKKSAVVVPLLLLGTVLAGIMGITNIIGYHTSIQSAQRLVDSGDYIEAYTELSGLEIKDTDYALYMETKLLAAVQYQLKCYDEFMTKGMYDLALDSLICGLGRAEDNEANAEYYGSQDKLNAMKIEILEALTGQFGVSHDEAKETYSRRRRTKYTHELYDYLDRAGFLYTD